MNNLIDWTFTFISIKDRFQPEIILIASFKDGTLNFLSSATIKPEIIEQMQQMLGLISYLAIFPEKDINQEEKLKALNYLNEQFTFYELRQKLGKMDFLTPAYDTPPKLTMSLLGIPNILPVSLIKLILKRKIKDPQFIGPLKFVLSIFIIPLWWMLIFFIIFWFLDIRVALVTLGTCILSLFLWQDLKVRQSP